MSATPDLTTAVEVPVYAEAFGRQIHLGTWLLDVTLVRKLKADPSRFNVRLSVSEEKP